MAIYDILMLLVFGGAILFGLWKGLAWQIASLAAVVASYFVAVRFQGPLTNWLNLQQEWAPFLSMLLLYMGTSLVIWVVYGYVRQSIKRMQLKEFDAQSGALLGAVKGALLCMVITVFAVTLLGDNARRAVIESRSGGIIAKSINRLNSFVPTEYHAVVNKYVQEFNNKIDQPLTPPNPSSQGSGWQSQFLNSAAAPPNNEDGFLGSFSRRKANETPNADRTELIPGVDVKVNSEQFLNGVQDRFRDSIGN